jgi:hypothetical protein
VALRRGSTYLHPHPPRTQNTRGSGHIVGLYYLRGLYSLQIGNSSISDKLENLKSFLKKHSISERKLHACFAFYLVLLTEFSTCQSTNLKRRCLDLFCNYYHISCVCNHFAVFVVIFCCCNLSFCHIFGTSKILPLT